MPDILVNMLSKLTGAYNKKADGNIGKLFSILADSMEDVEDTFQDINDWRDTGYAEGLTLDKIGSNFGVLRNGANDMLYALMIKIKLTSMLSGGDVNTIINATSALFEIDPEYINVAEVFPAEVQIIIEETALTPEQIANADIIEPIILGVISAGVKKGLYIQPE